MCLLAVLLATAQVWAADADPALSFAEAYRQIMDRNLRVETQKDNVEGAEARLMGKEGAFLPKLTGVVSRTDDHVDPGPTVTTPTTGLTLNLNVYKFGADAYGLTGAKADQRNARLTLESETLGAEEDAIEALVLVIQRLKEAEIAEKVASLKSEAYNIAKQRYQKGVLPILEVEKASIEFDNARARMNDGFVALSSARAALTALLGHARVQPEWPWKEKLGASTALEQRSFTLEQRPDVEAAKLAVDGETARTEQTYRSMFPSLDLQLYYGVPNTIDMPTREWTSLVTLTLPLFNQLQDYSTYHLQIATQSLAETRYELAKRTVTAQIETLRREFKIALESAQARDRSMDVIRRITDDSLQRFRMGRLNVNDLAIDQQRLLDSEVLDADGWGAAHVAFARLCHGLGERLHVDGSCGATH